MKLNEFINDLRQIVGESRVSTTLTDTEIYSYDASLAKGIPDVVVFPADAAEAARVVRCAYDAKVPYVPRGFGTNLSGGTVLKFGGMVICLSRFNKILAMHPDRRYARVQPGVTNLELQNALAGIGFFYAPDPASQKVATLGGNIGENSGGPRCLKYGVTTNHILGMEFIRPDGEIVRLGGAALDPPGYDLRGVVVGGEGTLGMVTELTVRILPLSEKVITMLAIYNDIADAARSVSAIISAGMLPLSLEMMDAPIINAVEDSYACGYPRDAAAVLIIEVEGPPAGLQEQADAARDLCMENGCVDVRVAKDDAERNRLWEGRRGAFGAVARLAPNYLVNDCTVPRTRLPEALAKVAEITKKYDFPHGNVFHAGDGNLHPLIFFDSRDDDQMHRVKKAGWEIMEACVALGGTISGEHGIGVEKMEAMRLVYTEDDFALQRALKKAFDPENLLNPGKVIPAPAESDTLAREVHEGEREIMKKIKTAISEGRAVRPVGRGARAASEEGAMEIDGSGLAALNEYDAANQVVSAGAGVTLENLQKALGENKQWLPFRPPFAHNGVTVGGLTAEGAVGPERVFYGAPRDRLLGLRVIDGEGRLICTGGKVVKNVSGYDMTRLIAGSGGTLGFITEAAYRAATLPERCVAVSGTGSLEECHAAAAAFNQSMLHPVFTAAIPDAATGARKLLVGFEGFSKPIDYQVEKAESLISRCGLNPADTFEYDPIQGVFREYFKNLDGSPFILRADFPLNRLMEFANSLAGEVKDVDMFVDSGCGRILAGSSVLDEGVWSRICGLAVQCDGHVLLEKAPAGSTMNLDPFGPFRPEWKISHDIKAMLDPHNLFTADRLPGFSVEGR
ncbi:MAG: FAD-binding protein [Desulfobacterales bacterium]|nr:FAD-binding protein [Desulfobacterales bacterium]